MDHGGGFADCLTQVSMRDRKTIPESHDIMVKLLFSLNFSILNLGSLPILFYTIKNMYLHNFVTNT